MIVIAGLVLGAVWGAFLARRRKGKTFDIAQYAVVYGIAFGLLGMIVTVALERLL
ncbi:hypothetical protein ATO10_03640 [Actibacterium atlanticum]|uniref:Uncharacterized protein n=1 Tax=Actibacterium atlanticum TaxID=1461693 RepID=A0A058ZRP4_9RHOB|nr:apolipoprotein acyltransferase [Actibacterium atlanticum]KCV83822.1 hypothetical protein ATO10_03640 [Actibacterium atlanticum]